MKNAKLIVFALVSCFIAPGLQAQNLSQEILQPDKNKDVRQSTQYYSPPANQAKKSKVLRTEASPQNTPQSTTNTDQNVLVAKRKITIQANSKKEVDPQKRRTKEGGATIKKKNPVVNNNINTVKLNPKQLAKSNRQNAQVSKASLNQKKSEPLDVNKMRQDILSKLNKAKTQAEKDKYQKILNQFDNKKF